MRLSPDLQGARLNIIRTAELLPMDVGHFRRLVKRGVFPAPKRNGKGKPYYDYDLLVQIAAVLKGGVGKNGEEVSFYCRKPKRLAHRAADKREQRPAADEYVNAVMEGCRQLGIANADLEPSKITALLVDEFKSERPPLEQAIPTIARRLLDGQG